MSFEPGQRVYRLSIVKRLDGQKHLVACECGSAPFPVYDYSLRTGRRRACPACQNLEKELQHQIETARRAAERNGLIFHEPSTRPKWEYMPLEELPEV